MNFILDELIINNNFIKGKSYIIKYIIEDKEYLELLGEYYGIFENEIFNFENGVVTSDFESRISFNENIDIYNIQIFSTNHNICDILKLIYNLNCIGAEYFYRIKRNNNCLLIINLNKTTSESNDNSNKLFLSHFDIELKI